MNTNEPIQKFSSSVLIPMLPEIEVNILNYRKYIDPYGNINTTTNVNGWQSQFKEFPFFNDWAVYLQEYIKKCFFLYHVKSINEDVHCHNGIMIFSWFNINFTNDFNTKHTHFVPNTGETFNGRILSGVFYVNDPGDSFYYMSSGKPIRYSSQAGDLLLFDTRLEHGVFPHNESVERISIAFNVEENVPDQNFNSGMVHANDLNPTDYLPK